MDKQTHPKASKRAAAGKRKPAISTSDAAVASAGIDTSAETAAPAQPDVDSTRAESDVETLHVDETPDADHAQRAASSVEQPTDPAPPSDSEQRP